MHKKMWEIKQQAQGNTVDIYIYGDVESDGYDWRRSSKAKPALIIFATSWPSIRMPI